MLKHIHLRNPLIIAAILLAALLPLKTALAINKTPPSPPGVVVDKTFDVVRLHSSQPIKMTSKQFHKVFLTPGK